jgi:transcriptional regulator with XRE-family HTH domain
MSANLAELCEKHQITITQVAERSGLEQGRVVAIYLGRWTPSPNERQKLAAVFQVTVDDITWGHKTPVQHIYGHGPG